LWRRDDRAKGANDNAAGLTTMIGIAEYFAKIPKEQRRRTIVFLGTTGHHNSSAESGAWLAAHPEAFDKTALLLNYEHTGGVETGPGNIRLANAVAAFSWYGTGQQLADIVVHAMDAFGVPSFPQSSPRRPARSAATIAWRRRSKSSTAATSGTRINRPRRRFRLAVSRAVTRTYAKVIADTDAIPIDQLRSALAPAGR
jgi:hypothetical protein